MPVARLLAAAFVLAAAIALPGHEAPSNVPTPLSALLKEASQNNTQISAADDAWRAAREFRSR